MLNMSFDKKVVIDTSKLEWQQSPRPGVWRKPLAREEAERGHATSIVRYEPGASFSSHDHPLGEEILVLEGVFSDESGDYKAGTYFRNPEGYQHAPFSKEGCIILVKLHQFSSQDTRHVCIDTQENDWQSCHLPLHHFESEKVFMQVILEGESVTAPEKALGNRQGGEIYILSGELTDGKQSFVAGTWIRHPKILALSALKKSKLWIKTGHF
jgi:hypothetical protein